jgi:hypothetical protein
MDDSDVHQARSRLSTMNRDVADSHDFRARTREPLSETPAAHAVRLSTDGGHMTRRSPSANRRDSRAEPTASSGTPTVDGLEERVLAFAEQLGRIAGTVQAKTAGWMDGDALKTSSPGA